MTGEESGYIQVLQQREHRAVDPATHGAGVLRTFFNIINEWQLSAQDGRALLGVPKTTYSRWRADPGKAHLTADQFERVSYVLGIYKDLQILFPDRETADGWMRRPNDGAMFGGRAPIERLRSGLVADLFLTRDYLDAARGVWC